MLSALCSKLRAHARHTAGAVTHRVEGTDALGEGRGGRRAARGRARAPRVVAALRDFGHLAERLDAVVGVDSLSRVGTLLGRRHTLLRGPGGSVFRMPRSLRTSRHSRSSSAHASHAAPLPEGSLLSPRCLERYCRALPASFASCGCSARRRRTLLRGSRRTGQTSATRATRSRNSDGDGRPDFGILGPSSHSGRDSRNPRQLQTPAVPRRFLIVASMRTGP